MLKAIFFDFDGVLTLEGHGCDAICRALSKQFNLAYEKVEPAFHNRAKNLTFKPIGYDTFIDDLNAELDSNFTVQDIRKAATTAQPNTPMIELAEELRGLGLITGIITDNDVERMAVLHQPFQLDKFQPLIVSARVGSGKWQSSNIFETAVNKAGISPNESLFIDNTIDNLEYAKQLGMEVYWHDHELNNVSAFRDRLKELGVKL